MSHIDTLRAMLQEERERGMAIDADILVFEDSFEDRPEHVKFYFRELSEKASTQRAALEAAIAAMEDASYLRLEVRLYARLMEERLRANDYKGGWQESSPLWLIAKCAEELGELAKATHTGSDSRTVGKEAADLGNCAMMVASVCGGLD